MSIVKVYIIHISGIWIFQLYNANATAISLLAWTNLLIRLEKSKLDSIVHCSALLNYDPWYMDREECCWPLGLPTIFLA